MKNERLGANVLSVKIIPNVDDGAHTMEESVQMLKMAYAEGTTTGMMFVSTDFPAHVLDKSLTPTPIDWSKYTLMTYNHGRLFRMGVGYFQNSPLGFNNSKGKPVFGYSPYFSIISCFSSLIIL